MLIYVSAFVFGQRETTKRKLEVAYSEVNASNIAKNETPMSPSMYAVIFNNSQGVYKQVVLMPFVVQL